MNITFEGTNNQAVRNHSNVDRDTTTYRSTEDVRRTSFTGFALDISGTVMDSNAYFGHGQTAEEVMQEAGQQDITARRNYMAVMSNSMSDEDFAKLQEEGFHPGSTDIETVVTIVDHIKASLIKGGAKVVGYTDTLDSEKLTAITGSEAFAHELRNQFKQYDIPLTEENVEAVTKAWHTLCKVQDLPEGSVKYLIENQMSPTVENLYLSRFSATGDGSRQGKGYYSAGEMSGYLAKKPENVDYKQLLPQMEKVIEEAGYVINEETLNGAKWLIEKGIPLNADTFSRQQQIENLSFPISQENFLRAATAAIADGSSPAKTDVSKEQSYLEQAVMLQNQVANIEEQAIDILMVKELPFTLKNLFAVCEEMKLDKAVSAVKESESTDFASQIVHGRRILEEVRLSMTVSANMKLLKSGFQIETAPMEELIENLKKAESSLEKTLMKETDATAAKEKNILFERTLFTIESIKRAPVAFVSEVVMTDTLQKIGTYATEKSMAYQKAGESYETLMTMPRKDLGDSINKAFQNVDDILADMDRETTQENRRVIRILGYNSMEMTEENFERIRQSDALLTEVVEEMKPATVLSMIREGNNPLDMTLEELKNYLDSQPVDEAAQMESYSRFLYQLEQKKGISSEERSAYIGIYRLLRQIEKGDHKSLGALEQAGTELTLGNLLTAIRSEKKGRMNYQIDDSFGGVSAKETNLESILSQIEKGYLKTVKQLENMLADEETEAAAREFDSLLFEETRNALRSEDAVLKQLLAYQQPVSADYLLAANTLQKTSPQMFRKLKELSEKAKEQGSFTEEETLWSDFTDSEKALESYEKFTDRMLENLEEATYAENTSSIDVKSMSTLYKQITFMKSMAREENYEMPVTINGTLTAVNLKMIHKDGEDSKVTITLETQMLGSNAAEFRFTKAGLSGYGICSEKEGSRLLEENRDRFQELLTEEGIEAGEIHFIEGKQLDLAEFSSKAEENRISGKGADMLYRAAKVYIGYIQEISKQKGNAEYENQL